MDGRNMNCWVRFAAHAALWIFIASVVAFGAMPAAEEVGFAHRTHPVAALGAIGMPGASLFNLGAFVLAGFFATIALWPLRYALPADAPWSARIGAQLVLLSGVAFAAQGLLPIDPEDLDGSASGLHGIAWTLWWLTFSAGNASIAWGLRKVREARGHEIVAAIAQIVPACALFAQAAMPIAVAQRVAFVLWFVWTIWVSSRYRRLRASV